MARSTADLVAALAADPRPGAVACDIDGRLAPIAPRPDHALRYLETQITPQLDRAGLAWSFGRMVLEVRPPVPIDKGSAVRRLRGRRRITELLYLGDDRTDLDAFREATIRIAVRSPESPPELLDTADGCVDG